MSQISGVELIEKEEDETSSAIFCSFQIEGTGRQQVTRLRTDSIMGRQVSLWGQVIMWRQVSFTLIFPLRNLAEPADSCLQPPEEQSVLPRPKNNKH